MTTPKRTKQNTASSTTVLEAAVENHSQGIQA